MNLLSAVRKAIYNFMNNCNISIGGDEVSVKYNDGENRHEFKAISNGDKTSIHYDTTDGIEQENPNSGPVNYSCVGSAICGLFDVFGSVYAVSLVVKNNSGMDYSGSFDKIFRESVDIKSIALELKALTSLSNDNVQCVVSTLGKNDDAYIVTKIISPRNFNNLFRECVEDVGGKIQVKENFYEKLKEVLFYNPENVPAEFHNIKGNVGRPAMGMMLELINSLKSSYTDPETITASNGSEGFTALQIANEFSSMELLSIGKTVKEVCHLSYAPEIPYISYQNIKDLEKFKKKYKTLFNSVEIQDISKAIFISKELEDSDNEKR